MQAFWVCGGGRGRGSGLGRVCACVVVVVSVLAWWLVVRGTVLAAATGIWWKWRDGFCHLSGMGENKDHFRYGKSWS